MADKEVKIQINTEADVSGAQQAEEAIKDLGKAPQSAMDKMAELRAEMARTREEAKNLADQQKAVDEQGAQRDDVSNINRKINAAAINEVAQFAGEAAREVAAFADELDEIDPEAADGVRAVSKAFDLAEISAKGAAIGMAIAGPPGAAIGAVILPYVEATKNEVKAAIEAYTQLKQLERTGAELPERIQRVKELMDMRAEIESWRELTAQMQAANDEAKLMAQALATQNKGKVLLAQADVEIARATGGDVAGAEDRLRQVQEAAYQSDQENKLAVAISNKATAVQRLQEAENKLLLLNQQYITSTAEEQAKIKAEMDGLRKQIDGLNASVKDAQDNLFLTEKQVGWDSSVRDRQGQAQGIDESNQSVSERLQNIVNDVKSKPGAGADLQKVLAEVESYIKDGVVNSAEVERLPVIMAQFSAQLMNLGVTAEKLEEASRLLDDHNRRIRAIEMQQK